MCFKPSIPWFSKPLLSHSNLYCRYVEANSRDASFSLQAAHATIKQLEAAMSSVQATHADALRREREVGLYKLNAVV
jgi:hypothetical protein